MAEAEVFNLNDFRKREDKLVADRVQKPNIPIELRGVSEETIRDRLVNMGAMAIITSRLASELSSLTKEEKSEIKQLRNLIMRRLGKFGQEAQGDAVTSADLEWEERLSGSAEEQEQNDLLLEEFEQTREGEQ
jgi:hypothetical protein